MPNLDDLLDANPLHVRDLLIAAIVRIKNLEAAR